MEVATWLEWQSSMTLISSWGCAWQSFMIGTVCTCNKLDSIAAFLNMCGFVAFQVSEHVFVVLEEHKVAEVA